MKRPQQQAPPHWDLKMQEEIDRALAGDQISCDELPRPSKSRKLLSTAKCFATWARGVFIQWLPLFRWIGGC